MILVLLLAPYTAHTQQLKISEFARFNGVVTISDLQNGEQAVHPAAARAMARGEKPGTFKNVRYELAPNVRMLTPQRKSSIRLQQDGILDLSGGGFKPSPDSIYLDPASDLVLQAEPVDDTRMLALRPSLSAVFNDIEVPEQEVPVTLANTISLAEGIVESSLQMNNNYAVNLQFDSVTYVLDKTEKDSLVVTLVGQILLTNPRVEGKYSKNNGYRLVFLASEQTNMKIYTSMKLKEEAKTPVWGTEIKMSDLGKCEIGLFILTTAEGNVTLAVEIHQGIEMAMGASGGTFWYIPTSIRNISTIDSWCEVDYNVTSQMKAFVGFQCTANLKVKGYNALDVYVNGGMEGTVATDGLTLNADVGMRLKAGGKVVSKKFTLLDNYYSLWKYQKPDYHGYSMIIHEACAWGDYVAGEINSLMPGKVAGVNDTVPYSGPLSVIVSRPGSAAAVYSVTSGEDGVFIARNVPLKKGDRVSVKLPGIANASPAVDVTIPFSEIKLYSADYFAGTAGGSVAGSRSRWAKLAGAAQGPAQAAVQAVAAGSPAGRLKGAVTQQEAVRRLDDFRNNLTVYRGPIEFITATDPPAAITPARSSGTNSAIARGNPVQGQNRTTATVQPGKITPQNGTVNSPLGLFEIGGLAFVPGQKVKARIVVEGFTIESDWVETEGLIVSAIENDGFSASVRPGSETLSATNSFVVVSALHGSIPPEGSVKIMRGADAPHSSLTAPQSVPEFPDARKARVWFNSSIALVPLEGHPGAAIASTGPWSVTYGYSSPGDAINPMKNRKHPFETVSFIYKDRDLGYSDYTDECTSCSSPANVIDRIGKDDIPGAAGKPGRQSMQKDVNVPQVKPQPQVKKPVVIR